MNYRRLRETWVIFITDRDVLGLGLPLYRIERQIVGTDRLFGDGAHIVFANAACQDDQTPMGRLMHDLTCPEPDRMYNEVLAKTVRHHKTDEEGVRKMSRTMSGAFAAYGKEERKRGRAEGEEQTRLAVVRSMLANGCSREDIVRLTSLPLDTVRALAGQEPEKT